MDDPPPEKTERAAAPLDGTRWSAMHRSVFAKLAVIMLALAASLLLLVTGAFAFLLGPILHSSIDGVVGEYTRGLAAQSLDEATARRLSARLNLDVRYEGPAGNWTTAPYLPAVRTLPPDDQPTLPLRHTYFVAPAPDGGTYLFAWSLGRMLGRAHTALLVILLTVMAVVIVFTYFVLKRLLRPLRRLSEGVGRLSAGEFDVVLPEDTRDEFGRLTRAFNRMVDRVRAMIASRDQLLLDVSHELRSPLTRLKVALELAPEGTQVPGMAADVAEMERMIAELLELERLRTGRGLRIERQDVLPILREVAGQYEARAPGVRLNVAESELMVDIDAEKVRTVFRNLLENAAKYARPESRPVEITVESVPGQILIRVTDDGPGIPATEAESIFEPFFRVDRSRSKNTGGYGLGLSICKRIMQAHGGNIRLDASRRPGASFILQFPSRGLATG